MSARPSPVALAFLIAAVALVAACDLTRSTTGPVSPSVEASGPGVTPSPTSTTEASPSPTPTPTPAAGAGEPGIRTACLNLGPADCQRAGDFALSQIDGGENPVVYLQVGPFGCADGERCPATLVARPEGDVTIEFAGAEPVGVHVRWDGGTMSGEQIETFGVVLDPTPGSAVELGPRPFDLGHCGLYSGIDLGGSWWDPVGAIDADHPDAINAASGILTVTDPDHATFVSNGGLTVQLVRRDGAKHLPMCA
jgi:hypothetical protein